MSLYDLCAVILLAASVGCNPSQNTYSLLFWHGVLLAKQGDGQHETFATQGNLKHKSNEIVRQSLFDIVLVQWYFDNFF